MPLSSAGDHMGLVSEEKRGSGLGTQAGWRQRLRTSSNWAALGHPWNSPRTCPVKDGETWEKQRLLWGTPFFRTLSRLEGSEMMSFVSRSLAFDGADGRWLLV